MFFGNKDKGYKRVGISSLQKLTLRISGMRLTEVYEILDSSGRAEISLYYMKYSREGDRLELQQRAYTGMPELMELLGSCDVGGWNGFVGPHPKNVRDGQMFELRAEVNGGESIYAHGSENFPKHYHEFVRALGEFLADGETVQV